MTFLEQVRKKVLSEEKFNEDHWRAYLETVQHEGAVGDRVAYAGQAEGVAREAALAGDLKKAQVAMQLQKEGLLAAAPDDFDSFIRYVEWNREPRKQFYLPRRKQLRVVVHSLQDLADGKIDLLGISLPPGAGKLIADDTPVPTKDGWKRHGDLKVGDYVVGMDGQYKKVLRVFPKDYADYEVTFANGEKIKCHGNHEWMVFNRHKGRYDVMETKGIAESVMEGGEPGHRGHRYYFQLPFTEPLAGKEADLAVDPYVFGAWLGDGTTTKPALTIGNADMKEIVPPVWHKYPLVSIYQQVGCKRYEFAGLREALQKYGLCQAHRTVEKYIPDVYLRASVNQRLELLAGMLDTDGCKVREGAYTYSSTNILIIDGLCELLSTFGWRYSITKSEPRVSTSGIAGKKVVYTVKFHPSCYIPCKVPRKQNHQLALRRRIGIASIRRTAPVPGNCIQVEDGMYLVGKTMLPTHNSTVAMFYLTWTAGRHPEEPMLTGSHSNSFVRGMYDECLRVLDRNGEYLWGDVFPGVSVSGTNAKDCRIDLGNRKRFETLEFTSIGTGNAGLYRASQLLYCDDLVSGIEVAMSKERLDKLWEVYTTDLRQRKIGDHCKELHIATRWSVHDVLGRLENEYANSDRARFIVIPALNEKDESNFNYLYGVGFTTKFYHEQRAIMDDVSWKAIFMQEPIERGGLLYHPDELQRYFDLPEQEPDAIISACDTKDKGADFCVMPIAYKYGDNYFIEDFVCSNANPETIDELLVEALIKHKVQMSRFESNSAGGRVAKTVQDNVIKRGGITKITTKFTTANKETKILTRSPFVKQHFYFKDESRYSQTYRNAMRMICSYSLSGKNKHDDTVDALAQLVDFIQSFSAGHVDVFKRPF